MEKAETNAEQMKLQISNLLQIIDEKENTIFQLQSDLPIKYKAEIKKNDLAKMKLEQHKNYAILNEMVIKGQVPTNIQWQQITSIIIDVYPGFNK
ncbi:hypothetical protein VPJ68_16505, partial [Parabacteroides distasonis]